MVQDIFVRRNAVWYETLIVEEAKVADEWRIGVFLHPFDIEGSWCRCTRKIDELAKKEMVVLATGQPMNLSEFRGNS